MIFIIIVIITIIIIIISSSSSIGGWGKGRRFSKRDWEVSTKNAKEWITWENGVMETKGKEFQEGER